MNIAYIDCFSGISGDMILGALVDIGINIDLIEEELKKIDIKGYTIKASNVMRGGISCTKVNVAVDSSRQCHTDYKDIKGLIEKSGLSDTTKSGTVQIFKRIAAAEAKVHNVDIDNVHFHEVGAVDSIIDIVGSVIGIEMLNVDKIVSSPVNTGGGMIKTEHGALPVPAPATAELLKGVPCYSKGVKAELTTPTGAVIVTSFADEFADLPMITPDRIGYGAGYHNPEGFPNMLRIIVGAAEQANKELIMLETNIDDMNPEYYDYLFEKGFNSGALDIFLTPIIMKKGRPATKVSILTAKDKTEQLTTLLFEETSSFGIRTYQVNRVELEREIIPVNTQFGEIKVKIGKKGNRRMTISPEYDDCKDAAKKTGTPVKDVYEEARSQAWKIISKVIC